jgi:hypothetical protein
MIVFLLEKFSIYYYASMAFTGLLGRRCVRWQLWQALADRAHRPVL